MKIKVSNLPEGIHKLELTKSVEELDLLEPFKNDLKLNCVVDKSHHQIIVNCNLSVDADFICDRCNEKFSDVLKRQFKLVYLFEKNTDKGKDVNVKFVSRTIEELNLTDDVIDYAYLSIPLKKLCNDDCKGLCASCGTNLNIKKCNCKTENENPVWDKLLTLKDKLN